MGTGIGRYCEVCGEQLNYDDGFNDEETLCNKCEKAIPKFLDYLAHKIRGN